MYSLDTCCLIYAMQQAYPISNFPAFWKRLDAAIEDGNILIIESVKDEISKFDNDLIKWVESLNRNIFTFIDNQILAHAGTIAKECPKLINKKTDKDEADPYIIALAMQHSCKVVTQENLSRDIKPNQKKIKIPDTCKVLGIACINLTQMIRELNWIFD